MALVMLRLGQNFHQEQRWPAVTEALPGVGGMGMGGGLTLSE